MKTQVSDIIDGSWNVVRGLLHPKYAVAKANYGSAIIGTDYETRKSIWERVSEENPEYIDLRIRGERVYHLKRHTSTTGKTSWYSTEITDVDYVIITDKVNPFTFETSFTLYLTEDLTVYVSKSTRKTPNSQWKHRGNDHIGTEFVEVL